MQILILGAKKKHIFNILLQVYSLKRRKLDFLFPHFPPFYSFIFLS